MKPVDHYLSQINSLKDWAEQHPRITLANQILDEVLENPLRQHCSVVNSNESKVTIAADNATWLTRLRYQKDMLIAAFQRHQHFAQITTILWRIHPSSVPFEKPTQPKVHRKISHNTVEQVLATAEHIRNPALKSALQRLGKHLKERT